MNSGPLLDAYWKAVRRRNLGMLPSSALVETEFDGDGNFTYCLVRYADKVAMGASKRRPDDTASDEVGRTVALTRALVKLNDKLATEGTV